MAGKKLTIKLTDSQQSQIKTATGRNVTELSIDLDAASALTERDLDQINAGQKICYDTEI